LAAVFALNGAVPSTAVSWTVTQLVFSTVPYVCTATWSAAWSDAWLSNVIGWPAAFSTCSASSVPFWRSPGFFGT
jgi:hypothetical protein